MTRAELAAILNFTPKQVDSAITSLLKAKAIRYNGIAQHRTYIATVEHVAEGRGKSAGSRAGVANLAKSSKRRMPTPCIYPDDWPRQISGGEPPKVRLRHALDIAWPDPVFPMRAKK